MVILWLCCGYHVVRIRQRPNAGWETERGGREARARLRGCGNLIEAKWEIVMFGCEKRNK